jgi:mRNA interferase ChpB
LKQGDIYEVDLEPVKGREQKGRRPVVVVSQTRFNQVTGLPIVAPISQGGEFGRERGFTVPLSGSGTKTQGVVLCHQLRVLDLQARNGSRIEPLPPPILKDVIDHLIPIFED